MNALKHHFSRTSLHIEYAFVAQHLLAKDLQNAPKEVFQLFMIKGFITTKNKGLDAVCMACVTMVMVVVTMIMSAGAVIMIMAVVMAAISVIVVILLQEMGVNIQLSVQIEALEVQDCI